MNAEFFLDTNILVHSFDETNPSKRKRSRELIQHALTSGKGAISWQVVQEFMNVALHQWEKPMTTNAASLLMDSVLQPLCRVFPSMNLYSSALRISEQTRYPYYDSLIIASAISSGASELYTEDLKESKAFEGIVIKNPFKS